MQVTHDLFAQSVSAEALRHISRPLIVVAVELSLITAVAACGYMVAGWLIRRIASFRRLADPEPAVRLQSRARLMAIAAWAAAAIGIVAYNGLLLARGLDVAAETQALLAAVGAGLWARLGAALGPLVLAAVGLWIVWRVIRWGLGRLEAAAVDWDEIKDNDQSLARLFAGLRRAIRTTGWLVLAAYACWLFQAPPGVLDMLFTVIRVYLVLAVGMLVVRSSVVVVDTSDALGRRYAERRGWASYHEHLRPLLPTFRACLEYASWVALASVALIQFGTAETLAAWGPKLIQAIGIFFLSRVVIELGRVEIGRRLLPREGLDEMTRRRRATIAPLLRSAFTYAVLFGGAVLILASLGFNPVPFLAGAGILGLVIGFGAQSLINDVVSGFFILFENTYLVGDTIEAAGARGTVEAIEFRTTKIRDADGRQHIVRNGDVKDVVNYSKDYTLAVVPVDVIYQADLRSVFTVLQEAGRRLRRENPDVLADTQIDGIVAFGPTTMTVRTSTRVKPGRHEATAAALRLAIKEAFDRYAVGDDRHGLIPVGLAARRVM